MMNACENIFGNVMYGYSRAQAIEEGVLIDVSPTAQTSGFKLPVAVTRSVWHTYIEWTNDDSEQQTSQNQSGRLADVLWMLYSACKRNGDESSIQYQLNVIPRDGQSIKPQLISLKAVIDDGDNGEAVITIMLPTED
ncbi:MAG: DUF6573 family protein [Gammaproteobacteria bacterium]